MAPLASFVIFWLPGRVYPSLFVFCPPKIMIIVFLCHPRHLRVASPPSMQVISIIVCKYFLSNRSKVTQQIITIRKRIASQFPQEGTDCHLNGMEWNGRKMGHSRHSSLKIILGSLQQHFMRNRRKSALNKWVGRSGKLTLNVLISLINKYFN